MDKEVCHGLKKKKTERRRREGEGKTREQREWMSGRMGKEDEK